MRSLRSLGSVDEGEPLQAPREGRLEKGKLIVLCAFGAGLNWGGALVRW